MTEKQLPQTDSIRELARFWDTHDLTDFEDELEEVPEPVFERHGVVRVPLEQQDIEALEHLARARGIDPVELVREWIQQKVGTA